MHAVPLILCLLVVAVCAVPPHDRVARHVPNEWNSNSELVKRVLALLDQEKRKFNFFEYDPVNDKLKVDYKVCVHDEMLCRDANGHKVQIFKKGKKVFEATEQSYLNEDADSPSLAPEKTYTVKLTKDVHTLKACATDFEGKLIECNSASFNAGQEHMIHSSKNLQK